MDESQRLGARVQMGHLDDPTLFGLYHDGQKVITIDLSLPLPQKKEAWAHENGHCLYGDDCSSPERERRADRYAANFLISPTAYRAAELIDPDPAAIAAELGQTRRMVRVFQREWLPALSLTRRLRAV